jgi:hypothetical protein
MLEIDKMTKEAIAKELGIPKKHFKNMRIVFQNIVAKASDFRLV